MSVHLDNFRSWFVRPLEVLYSMPDTGFPISMIAFPLLERYLRQKLNISQYVNLADEKVYVELHKIFQELGSSERAKQFWHVFRNGILHQVTLLEKKKVRDEVILLPGGCMRSDIECLRVQPDGYFYSNPIGFAKRVIQRIEADFATYQGDEPPLTSVWPISEWAVTSVGSGKDYQHYPEILGTSVKQPKS
jgi:hypothetical protein